MRHYSILSPTLGKREDAANILLQDAFTPDAQSCQYWNGKVRTSYGRTPELIDSNGDPAPVTDNLPVLKSLWHQSDSATKHLLAFTAEHIYRWSEATQAWVELYTCGESETVVTAWSVTSFNGKVIATNNVDAPILWDGTTEGTFGALSATTSSGVTISRAKCVTEFENHVVFGNYDLSDASSFENGIIISDLDDETEWETGDASTFYVNGEGIVNAFGKKSDLLYVFKTASACIFWYTGTELILNSRPYVSKVGTFAPDSVGNDSDGNLYFLGSDQAIREVDVGIISQPIRETVRTINNENEAIVGVRFAFIAEYNECWFACPVNDSDTNNIILCFIKPGIWYTRHYAVSCFGQYQQTSGSFTWDNQPPGTWDDWTGVWNDATESAGWIKDLCFDYYGYGYTSHSSSEDTAWNGAAMANTNPSYYFVMSVDMGQKQALRYYKRLLYLYGYFTSINGNPVNIYVKQDNEASWQSAGTMITTGTAAITLGELAVDYRARHFLVKIESSSPFEFLGMEFDFNFAGER